MTLSVAVFDAALTGRAATLVGSDGSAVGIETRRWRQPADADDAWLLERCLGPTVDLGCGPGRLIAALAARGVPALGVDHSPVAQAHCRRRGVPMVLGEIWSPLPEEGHWRHALLADGNIGIGGEPVRLLARAARLLAPGGSVLVEIDPDPATEWRGTVAVRTAAGLGPAAPWARIGRTALRAAATVAGLAEVASHDGRRCFSELSRPLAPGAAPARRGSPTRGSRS